MPRTRTEFFEEYPYRVEILMKIFEPGEYVPNVPREFPDHSFDEDGNEITPDYPTELPRGETQLVARLVEIYYDVAGNRSEPEWKPVAEVMRALKAREAEETDT